MSARFGSSEAACPVDGRGARRASLVVLAVLALLLGALVLSSSASALGQRGHSFSFSFGSQGKGEGRFARPSGVAVNNSTGDVYVADRDNNRVEEFAPELKEGALVGEAFVSEFKVPYPVYIAVDNSTEASDPSKGDVYVIGARGSESHEAEPEELGVYKFSSSGTQIYKLAKFKLSPKTGEEFEEEFEALRGVAVDAHGSLFVYQEEEIYKFNDEEKNKAVAHLASQAGEARPGLAVDSEGNFDVGVGELTGAGEAEEELTALTEEEGLSDGLFKEEEFAVIAKINGAGAVVHPELDPEFTPALAVNPAEEKANEVSELNDVYVANVGMVAGEPATTVAAFTPSGSLIQRFSAPGLRYGAAIAVNSASGAVYVADADANRIDVFELEPHGHPQVDSLSSRSVPPPSEVSNVTIFEAQINPTGAATKYQFEYGAASCGSSSCTKLPASPAELGEGFAGFGDRGASAELQNLPVGLYHYRVVATSDLGATTSAERTFAIHAAANPLPDGREWEMVSPVKKNGAEPEAMTKNGVALRAAESGDAITYAADGPMPAGTEIEGSRSPEDNQILSVRSPGGWSTQDISTPNTSGIGLPSGAPSEYQAFSPSLALALVEPFPGARHAGGFADPPLAPPLTEKEKALCAAGTPYQEKTIYIRDDGPEAELTPSDSEMQSYEEAKANGEPKPCGERTTQRSPGYLALVTELNSPGGKGEPFGGGYIASKNEGLEFLGATADLGHAVFWSRRADPGVYEWGSGEEGRLHPVDELPEKRGREEEAELGGAEGKDPYHAISGDGTRVFWTGLGNGETHLYVRDTAREETLQLDTVQPKATGVGAHDAQFQTASADGSRVFFTDEQRLTPDSKAAGAENDLYVAELSGGGETPLTYTLTDLTPEGLGGESADVQGELRSVLGTSEDGSYMYFVADAALAPGATRGTCGLEETPAPGTTCNLYERHYNGTGWEPTKFITPLSIQDLNDWGGLEKEDLSFMTANVSPNGRYLAFMSDLPLTGYDNADASPEGEAEGARDEEVFLYDAETERITCVSCNPSGARPKGVHDDRPVAEGLLVDEYEIWGDRTNSLGETTTADHWLAGNIPGWARISNSGTAPYPPRDLTDSGRVFFNSPDALVPAVAEEKASEEKVYEYEPDGAGSCASAGGCIALLSKPGAERESVFLEASASGNDAFFLTANQLVSQDEDTSYDIYDAHVCEAASPCLPAPPGAKSQCESEETCREGYSNAPGLEAPASTGVASGLVAEQQVLNSKSSSPPPPKPKTVTRAEKLAKALKVCRTKYKAKSKKRKRASCERQARRAYGAKTARKSSAKRRAR